MYNSTIVFHILIQVVILLTVSIAFPSSYFSEPRMDLAGVQVPTFDWSSNDLPSAFRQFRAYATHVFNGPLEAKSDSVKASYLQLWLGPTGIDLIHTFQLSENDQKNPKAIMDRLEKHFSPKTNFRLARFNLQKIKQRTTESTDDFIARLRLQSDKCRFTDENEKQSRILEQLIAGSIHQQIQEKLLTKDETFTLDQAVDLCRTHEANLQHMADFCEPQARNGDASMQAHALNNAALRIQCKYCGQAHAASRFNCPATNSQCGKCGKIGHWSVACRLKSVKYSTKPDRKRQLRCKGVAELQHNEESNGMKMDEGDDDAGMTFDMVRGAQRKARREAYADISVRIPGMKGTHTFHAKVDTGADGNILPMRCVQRMKNVHLEQNKTRITAYNGTDIEQYGILKVNGSFGGKNAELTFHVVKSDGPILVGLPACEALQLVSLHQHVHTVESEDPAQLRTHEVITDKEQLISLFPEQFTGIGSLPGKAHLDVDPAITPVIHKQRRCPIHVKDDLKKELDAMEKLDVIAPVEKATDWVSSLTVARKPSGKLRVCLDPTDLNKALRRPQHRIITPEEITYQMLGAQVFSKLDARSGYWAIELDDESSWLTTFNSPFGRYRFKRLPFGINVSQDLFQKKMDEVLFGLDGVISIADDICVFGRDPEEHSKRLRELMNRARDKGLVFNADKCSINLKEITFFGQVYSAAGVAPDPAKVKAIKSIRRPQNVKELQSFLGLCTYLSAYIPRFSEKTQYLRQMLKEGVAFDWSEQASGDFESLKKDISSDTVLAYYDPKKPATIEVDASGAALGAVLLQEGQPVAYASKALTETENTVCKH